MKILYIVGNWKSNKTIGEATLWWESFVRLTNKDNQLGSMSKSGKVNIVLCAPFTVLPYLKSKVMESGVAISLGAQDVSPFPEGAYTGEVNARMVKELADYVIIGHSERRRYFKETDEELEFETLQASSAELSTIYCIEGQENRIPASVTIAAYEPPAAIGGGQAEDVGKAGAVCNLIREKTKKPVLYGGSVTPRNVAEFFKHPAIDGVLLGGASLDPEKFYAVIQKATETS